MRLMFHDPSALYEERMHLMAVCFDKVRISVATLSVDYHLNNNINNL